MSTIGVREFQGKIGLSYEDSKPWWPQPIRAPRDAPNVLYIVLDDVGFGHLSCYGGEVETPTIDSLAGNGIRYTQFHTTALCSPTRSCLLTGRNHHSNHMACITEVSSGFPGYDAAIPKENGTIAEYLKGRGYSTYALGKWHLTPGDEESWVGPRDHWPLGMGFDHFYGFLGAEANQYYPDLVEDNHPVRPPKTPEEGYHLMTDLADHAIEFIANHLEADPERPFLMYFCPGACHAPHHAPKEWIEKYEGKFDKGWDVVRDDILSRQKAMGIIPPDTELAPHLPTHEGPSPTWDSLSEDQKRLYSRMMAVFAGYLSYADHEIGRLINFLKENGLFENTLIVVVSDNGASGEGGVYGSTNENKFLNNIPESLEENLKAMPDLGGPKYYNHYPQGWALAGNTPFKFYKRYTYEGGVCDPFIVHWPKNIKANGGLRHQYHHAIDVVPTILEATGIEAPEVYNGIQQRPIEGVSMVYSFSDPKAPTRKEMQYYEMMGSRAIWHAGWKAVTRHEPMSETGHFDEDVWELYHVDEDRSEIHDVSKQYPQKLEEMRVRWWVNATAFNVLPLDDRGTSRLMVTLTKPTLIPRRTSYEYFPNAVAVSQYMCPQIANASFGITAEVEIPPQGAEGVILSQGSQFGYSLFVKNKRLFFVYNYVGSAEYRIASNVEVPIGKHKFRFEFQVTGAPDIPHGKGAPGIGRLLIDDKVVGEGQIPVTVPLSFAISGGGISCGRNEGQSVTSEYKSPFKYSGKIKKVTLDFGGEPFFDAKAELRKILTTV